MEIKILKMKEIKQYAGKMKRILKEEKCEEERKKEMNKNWYNFDFKCNGFFKMTTKKLSIENESI